MPEIGALMTLVIVTLGLLLILQVVSMEQVLSGIGKLFLAVFAGAMALGILGAIWRNSVVPALVVVKGYLKAGLVVTFVLLVLIGGVLAAVGRRKR